ncbi:hypothetical protein Q1695_006686 [Nippostrongylus brasiliensis]|nr:hypothetical protein Q1695_006686 [Nippostrongylus brasiliensis]
MTAADIEVVLYRIPSVARAAEYSNYCTEKAEHLQNLLRNNVISSITLNDRFSLMSRGHIPFVRRPHSTYFNNKIITVVPNRTPVSNKKKDQRGSSEYM